jgi:hypothetical protein
MTISEYIPRKLQLLRNMVSIDIQILKNLDFSISINIIGVNIMLLSELGNPIAGLVEKINETWRRL